MPLKHTAVVFVSLVSALVVYLSIDLFDSKFSEGHAAEPASFRVIPDPGIPDTVRAETVFLPAGSTTFDMRVFFYNDENLMAFSLPLVWDSPDISCDSVIFTGSRVDYIATKEYEIDNAEQQLLIYGIVFFESNISPGTGLLCTMRFSVDPAAAVQIATINTSFLPPATYFSFNMPNGEGFEPQFVPGEVRIYSTSTEEASWGAIKSLYR